MIWVISIHSLLIHSLYFLIVSTPSTGLSGLEELEKLDSRFTEFRESLYSPAAKNFERSVQTEAINKRIDEQIDKFLILVSPYFTLKAAHKAIEWLVSRYHVHQFNKESWIMCILPFHDTKIFVRALQVLDLKDQHNRWHWLHSLQKPGIPLTKRVLLNHCCADLGFLKFVCSMLKKFLHVHSAKKEVLKTFTAFFSTTLIGTLEYSEVVKEEQVSTLLPSVFDGLNSRFADLVAGCYMVIAQLARKAKLVKQVAEEIVCCILRVSLLH